MSGRQRLVLLVLLSVFVALARCQQKPQVTMSPRLNEVFSGDTVYLSCGYIASGSQVKWFVNDKEQSLTDQTWKIAVASPQDFYHCEINGQKSDNFSINVLEYSPIASLTIKTGYPVMQPGHSVILQLDNEDGLQGWRCWVYRSQVKELKRIALKLQNNFNVVFQTRPLEVPETIFWCTDSEQRMRSNQVIVRTSDQEVSLEMYPLPAVLGEELRLRCLVWGTDQISETAFYKDNAVMIRGGSSTHIIPNVTEFSRGQYKCDATYTHKARTRGPPYHKVSDTQDVFVQAHPVKAVLSANNKLSCSCPQCHTDVNYRWYHKDDSQPWAVMSSTEDKMTPTAKGHYACRAVWDNKRSFLSNVHPYNSDNPNTRNLYIIVLVVILIGLLVTGLAVWYKCYMTRDRTGPIYEDVALMARDKDKYEELQRAGGKKREGEYETLHPQAPGRKIKEGDYQELKKERVSKEVYHTLGPEGPAEGERAYEPLRQVGVGTGVYHTLEPEGPAGGERAYEPLRQVGGDTGIYHTLGEEVGHREGN